MTTIKEQWKSFRRDNPKVRIREAAKQLGTTEAEILASFAGSSVMLLNKEFAALVKRLPELGNVMVLTRNEYCVHERKGTFQEIAIQGGGHVGVVTGPDIDLRIFFRQWAFGFAQFADDEAGFRESLQFFDHQGVAILKVYLQADSDRDAFAVLVREFSAQVQSTELTIAAPAAAPVYKDGEVDVTAFRADWAGLKDTHDFFPLLMKHKVSRLHALHIAGAAFAKQAGNDTVVGMLQAASAGDWEIMVFVGNHGNIQIHTGPVKTILPIPGWINVMDALFNLHLRLPEIAESWVVRKPTEDGDVHSLELYDAKGDLIVQFFGKRKPGIPENAVWREWLRAI